MKLLLGLVLIAAAALLIYLPSLGGGFILDDDVYVTDSPIIKASDGLYRFWFTTQSIDYWPLTNTSFWIEWRLWGLNPVGYHVTNLVLHVASALLVWVLLHRLSIPGAWLAAFLFAVHPVNVESVAWISQRKNTLSILLFLLSILWYLKADTRTGRWYWLSLLAFILAMLSKGSVAILPAVLLILAWWQRGVVNKRDLLRTAPFFVVAVVLAAVNVWFQTHGSGATARSETFLERLLGAGAVVWFYLYKALLPVNLVFIYPQWDIEAADWRWWAPLAATALVTMLLLWQRNSRWGRPLLFAWLFFCAALLPVMGFTDVGFMMHSLVADRYLHIAIIGVVTLVAAGWSLLYQRARGPARSVALVTSILVAAALTLLARQQSSLYVDANTLYQETLIKNPNTWLIQNNFGEILASKGQYQEALVHFQQALRIRHDFQHPYNNVGKALANLGRLSEAIAHFQEALRLDPNFAEGERNLGAALKQAGRLQEAIQHGQKALQIKPRFPEAHFNLGDAFLETGRLPEAIDHYQDGLRLKPDVAEVRARLGEVLLQSGRPTEAIEQYQKALQIKPDYPEVHNNLANALLQLGRPQEALEHYQQALRLKPEYIDAHNNLANLLKVMGQIPQAIEHYQQALRLKPDAPEIHVNLGITLKQAGRLEEAIGHYQEALRLKPDYAEAHSNLGNALLQSGRNQEAIEHYQQSLRLKPDAPRVYANLGKALIAMGRTQEAIERFQKALQLKPDMPDVGLDLAMAYAQMNRSAEAIAAAQKALDLARASGQTNIVQQIESWLTSHRASLKGSQDTIPQPAPKSP